MDRPKVARAVSRLLLERGQTDRSLVTQFLMRVLIAVSAVSATIAAALLLARYAPLVVTPKAAVLIALAPVGVLVIVWRCTWGRNI